MKHFPVSSRHAALVSMLAASLTSGSAAFAPVDDFAPLTNGPINGQNGWVTVNAGSNVANDPEDPANKVLEVTTTSARIRKAVSLAQGTTGTLFFRFRYGGPKNFSIGLSDTENAGATGNFGDYETQLNVNNVNNGLNARSGGAFLPTEFINSNIWFNVWMVIDNTADTFKLYRTTTPNIGVTENDRLSAGAVNVFNFRNAAASSNLIYFLVMTGGAGTGGVENHSIMWLDDVYLDASGENLSNPIAAPATPLAFSRQPASVTVPEQSAVVFLTGVTGAPPRSLQWQRSDGSGSFTNIPGATNTAYVTAPMLPPDSGTQFLLIAGNGSGSITSEVATVTVVVDTAPLLLMDLRWVYPFDQALLRFTKRVDPSVATSVATYSLTGLTITSATVTNLTNVLLRFSTRMPAATDFTLSILNLRDTAVTPNTLTTNLSSMSPMLVNGYARAEYYRGIVNGAVADLTNNAKWPNLWDDVSFRTTFDGPANVDETYGLRLWAFFVPPTNGLYSLYLRSDDQALVFMNTNAVNSEDPAGKVRIMSTSAANSLWSTNLNQRATNLNLVAGQRYYIEGLLKEGTGGDYLRILFLSAEAPMPADGATTPLIPAANLATYAEYPTFQILQQPQGGTYAENRRPTLRVIATVSPVLPLTYQWRKNGEAIAGATAPVYTVPPLAYPGDDGASFDLVISTITGSVTSAPAMFVVTDDTAPPFPISAGSLDGRKIGVRFNELLNTNSSDTLSAFSYEVLDSGGAGFTIVEPVGVDASGDAVVLSLDQPISGTFTVRVITVPDLAGNSMTDSGTVTGRVWTLTGQDVGIVGNPLVLGSAVAFSDTRLHMTAGGTDIWSTNDYMHFVSEPVSGDFDARVRVENLLQRDPWSKAGLIARPTLSANSRNIGLFGAPELGQNTYTFQWRDTDNGTTVSLHRYNGGPQAVPAYPNAWIRLQRIGAVFIGSVSSNGVDWVEYSRRNTATNTAGAFADPVYVGLAATSHNNASSQETVAVFDDFSLQQLTVLPDLAVTTTATPSVVQVGGTLTCTISITNKSLGAANAALAVDTLPAGVSVLSLPAGCVNDAGVVTCDLGTLAGGQAVIRVLQVTADAPGSLTNLVSVSSASGDANPANNQTSAIAIVASQPMLGGVTLSGGTFNFSFATQIGLNYIVEYKNALTDANWQFVQSVPGTGATINYPVPDPNAPTRFYRVRIQ